MLGGAIDPSLLKNLKPEKPSIERCGVFIRKNGESYDISDSNNLLALDYSDGKILCARTMKAENVQGFIDTVRHMLWSLQHSYTNFSEGDSRVLSIFRTAADFYSV